MLMVIVMIIMVFIMIIMVLIMIVMIVVIMVVVIMVFIMIIVMVIMVVVFLMTNFVQETFCTLAQMVYYGDKTFIEQKVCPSILDVKVMPFLILNVTKYIIVK